MKSLLRIKPQDSVAVALKPLRAGETVQLDGTTVQVKQDIPQGHKIALVPIKSGQDVIKYGVVIGRATEDIQPGYWVHTHNMKTNLDGEVHYTYKPSFPELPKVRPETFMGYRRSDGRTATRNEIWIIPTVGCVNEIGLSLARRCQDLVGGAVDGIFAFTHPFGCSQTGNDLETTRKLLVSLSRHPNAGGVLFLSLGCESCTHQSVLDELGDYDPERVKFLTCQDVTDELESGRKIIAGLAKRIGRCEREPIPVSELVIGMKCGGSDGLSGITSNPVIGHVSDMVVECGGSTVLTEVPEMFGAESFLLNRSINRKVFDEAAGMINGFKDYFISHGEKTSDNPSPGNKQGGITTLEDKSCGCVQKGGTAPIMDVLPYAGIVHTKGLNLLCSPGNDMVSTTALCAAGCHLILFSTGRGTPFGAPVPTLKVYSNSALMKKKLNWMDFNAGVVADGKLSIEQAGEELYKLVLEVASGKKTSAELRGSRDISIWKDGVVL
ncbi:UxaA family hydrolase [Atopobium sp. oral taxon 416]|uniref:UxaA family hydrolase n=1 Tax=Atopobium sp. oral taxon 416 TaxID=712157 RepID=UPI001BAD4C4B|nr:altronate dehydratase family protein [Atopobium sp. oral taxon 416]QUC03564.1 altronate dehydratase [Atopobium sp. oral taxon 416]